MSAQLVILQNKVIEYAPRSASIIMPGNSWNRSTLTIGLGKRDRLLVSYSENQYEILVTSPESDGRVETKVGTVYDPDAAMALIKYVMSS